VSKGLERENGEPTDVVAAWPVNITMDTSKKRGTVAMKLPPDIETSE
jgi:hypothetical protein